MGNNKEAENGILIPVGFEEEWKRLEKQISNLKIILEGLPIPAANHQFQFSPLEYMDAYTAIYNLCLNTPTPPSLTTTSLSKKNLTCRQKHLPHHPHQLHAYNKYRHTFEDYLKSSVLPSIREKHQDFMLMEVEKRWVNHKLMIRCLSHLFGYLDRFFVKQHDLPSLHETGLISFRDLVYKEINAKVTDAVLTLINKEREGQQIDRALLKNVIGIFVEIDMGKNMDSYELDFEQKLLQQTSAYYSHKASDWIRELSCLAYILKSEECLEKEKDRVSHYLQGISEPKLVERIQHEFLVVHQSELLEKDSGCHAWLRDGKGDDLSRMFGLYHNIPGGLEPLARIFKGHITCEGETLVQQAAEAATAAGVQEQVLVTKILDLHDKYEAYVTDYFGNHTLFHRALKAAFEIFCNKTVAGSTTAEVFATFYDNILKKGGSTKLSDEVFEEKLEKVLKLLAYVNDKDVFAEFYRKKLARRLLFDGTSNYDLERSILSKMKHQFGGQFTSTLEVMVKDLVLSKDNQSIFQEYLSNNQAISPGIDFSVTMLTTGLWPTYKSCDLILPAEMVKCIEAYKGYYDANTKHRKLTWIFSLGYCHINCKFEQKTIELIVTTQQAAALMLFNDSDRLSYSEIMTQLNITHDDLVRLLHSLSCGKYKILTKEPNTKTISENDCFQFNHKFTDRMRRIKIPIQPVDERRKVFKEVNKDRQYAIDAAIVRIMKSRKALGHQQLISEAVEQLSRMFKPDIKAIKKQIEDLINRGYLEREEEDPNSYRYKA